MNQLVIGWGPSCRSCALVHQGTSWVWDWTFPRSLLSTRSAATHPGPESRLFGGSRQEESTLQNGLLWNQNCELLLLSLHNQTKTTEHRRCCDVSPYHARYPLIFQLLKTRSQWPIGGSTHSHTDSNWMMDPKRAQVKAMNGPPHFKLT